MDRVGTEQNRDCFTTIGGKRSNGKKWKVIAPILIKNGWDLSTKRALFCASTSTDNRHFLKRNKLGHLPAILLNK